MKVAFGTVAETALTKNVVKILVQLGYQIQFVKSSAQNSGNWADVGREVAEEVAQGNCNMGIAICWTGNGVSIAANRVGGARAAFCPAPRDAIDARRWHHSNVLALRLKPANSAVTKATVKAWLRTDPGEGKHQASVRKLESQGSY